MDNTDVCVEVSMTRFTDANTEAEALMETDALTNRDAALEPTNIEGVCGIVPMRVGPA